MSIEWRHLEEKCTTEWQKQEKGCNKEIVKNKGDLRKRQHDKQWRMTKQTKIN